MDEILLELVTVKLTNAINMKFLVRNCSR